MNFLSSMSSEQQEQSVENVGEESQDDNQDEGKGDEDEYRYENEILVSRVKKERPSCGISKFAIHQLEDLIHDIDKVYVVFRAKEAHCNFFF